MSPTQVQPTARPFPALAVYVAAVVVVSSVGSLATSAGQGPDGWYAAADRPWFTPPGWLFGVVWTLLYAAMALAAWRLSRRRAGGSDEAAPLLDVLVAVLVVRSWRVDRVAAGLLAPYLLWILFATALNASIAALN